MKKYVLFIAMVLASSVALADEEPVFETVKIRNDRSYEEYVVLMCDDTYQDGADFIVPGEPARDFHVLFHTYMTDGKSSCKLIGIKNNKNGTHTYRVKADENCEVEFRFKAKKTKVLYGFSAC